MTKGDVSAIKELGRNLDLFIPKVTRKKIMEGSENITAVSSKKELAEWVEGAMGRMDALVDKKTRIKVMGNCGHNCALVHKNIIFKAKGRRKKFSYCGMLRGLPVDETISSTYCHCAKGFVKSVWEGVLERPLKVELIQSVVTGARECKFAICL